MFTWFSPSTRFVDRGAAGQSTFRFPLVRSCTHVRFALARFHDVSDLYVQESKPTPIRTVSAYVENWYSVTKCALDLSRPQTRFERQVWLSHLSDSSKHARASSSRIRSIVTDWLLYSDINSTTDYDGCNISAQA